MEIAESQDVTSHNQRGRRQLDQSGTYFLMISLDIRCNTMVNVTDNITNIPDGLIRVHYRGAPLDSL